MFYLMDVNKMYYVIHGLTLTGLIFGVSKIKKIC